jgi:hypothetical protein
MTTTCKCGATIVWQSPGTYRCVWCGRTWVATVEETPDSKEDWRWNDPGKNTKKENTTNE